MDPVTGEVDINGFNKAIREAQTQARAARTEVRRIQEQAQEREAYQDYPELDPNAENHDKTLFRKTRAVLLDSMMNPQDYDGRQVTLKEAADIASGGDKAEQAKQEGAKEALRQQETKEQASLGAESRSDRRRATQSSLADLRKRSRMGDDAAIAERLNNLKE